MNTILKTTALIAMTLLTTPALAASDFDPAVWESVADDPDASDPRFDMIDAAIAAVPPGTPRDKVRQTLGAPDEDYGTEWVYYAGTTLFGGEYILLVLAFEGDDLVRAERVEHSETYVPPQSRDKMQPAG
ncbi:hypothetical protein [Paracoccus jiaweipingae]|uniref:hypothetical protein n=1 Tax=unclassified Paracoccus (in: a-proteobacteria) TaxID=2688777 RepID=UPI0037B94A0F